MPEPKKRDPLADPMPGDIFRNKGGTTYTIVDRFISIGVKKGSAMPGYFVRMESPDGVARYGSMAIVIMRFRKKTWTVVKVSKAGSRGWEKVSKHAHAEVDANMRRKHGITPR